MTPTIIIDSSSGRVRLVIGAAGGIRITTSTVYVYSLYSYGLRQISNENVLVYFKIPADNGNCANSTNQKIKAMIRNLWLGENIKEAIDSPRFHHQLFPMTLNYEKGFPKVHVYLSRIELYEIDTITNGPTTQALTNKVEK